ncbi:alanyl-tRNA synthetase [Moraxella bovoculi]|uniref:Alanine--tRNA ligase n=1 Tax=Moraxella bovoculi TaxID=386891 RepID=A0AAC8PVV6_9GAMM|nr:alanine--tRNA ligase [Moraxella bovoculi]AKG07963.1 alanyl-tRNA synthetase [Moraxella bovoculi]AKG09501.1 alanyl-tRNA synthetase [Moraxella bovoculi]AKG11316.1 alanyl-tRNA synthetase [Moraxella bovoculi]AKG13324.1 alanyl-tRNA synthetase [Moraxella bovoculi]
MTHLKKTLQLNEVRQAFVDFFKTKNHTHVDSSSLIPHNDPTLLFTNAGMNQFKDTFLGLEKRDYNRAVTSQKCVRAGGKHNDLDNVGYTARHHTFFEMLGNFSFGDYFKQDALKFAWEFLTSEDWLALPKDRLYATVYHTDDEAYDIWHKEIGLDPSHIIRIGDKGKQYESDNFWTMGDTGPCGPCSEIFYDYGEHIEGGLPGTPEEDGDRYVEVWNCVFMQFNRQKDGTLEPLPKPSVDTGMGLERISSVMQGKQGNYEVDLFVNLMDAAAKVIGVSNTFEPSFKVVADHIRAVSFLIADGVRPSNEGRGYVLRRIIRRAVRHGNKLGAEDNFFYQLVPALVKEMGDAYPELAEKQEYIQAIILKEEEQFAKTLAQGLRLLSGELDKLNSGDTLSGETVFKLYDTYGFPTDLTADIARERDINIDEDGFEALMQEQRERARDAGKFDVDYTAAIKVDSPTEFVGYGLSQHDSQIIGLYQDGKEASELGEGDEGVIVLSATPFYAEGGGQVGELGEISTESGVFEVQNTKKSGTAIIHYGTVKMGSIKPNQSAHAQVIEDIRRASAKNHSATHLLHAALRSVLGTGVAQKGSLVSSEVLRFDFSHDEPISQDDLLTIERMVNEQIQKNSPVQIEHLPIDEAMKKGAMALFGEKYGETVRVLTMGENADKTPFSIELCGGLHVVHTGDIGLFKIVAESGIAAGVRRIEALTGMGAIRYVQQGESILGNLATNFKAKRGEIETRVTSLSERSRELEKQLEKSEQKLASYQAASLLSSTIKLDNGVNLLVTKADGIDGKAIRGLMDTAKSRLDNAVIVLVGETNDLALAASVAKGLTDKVKAGDIIRHLAAELSGKGGGKPDYAQGGAEKSDKLGAVLSALKANLSDTLA